MPTNLCGFKPLFFFGRKPSKLMEVMRKPQFSRTQKPAKGLRKGNSCHSAGNFFKMLELRKKIIAFRDMIELPPCNSSIPIDKLMIVTMKEIHIFYPEMLPVKVKKMKGVPIHQVLAYFCRALQAMGDPSLRDEESIANNKNNLDKLVEITIATLNGFMKRAREKFDIVDEDEEKKEFNQQDKTSAKDLKDSYSDISSTYSSSPTTPTSILPEIIPVKSLYSSPLLLSLRVQAVGKLNPIDVKQLAFNVLQNVGAEKSKILNQKHEKIEQLDAKAPFSDESKDSSSLNGRKKFPISFPKAVNDVGSNPEVIELLLPLPSQVSEPMELEAAVTEAITKVLPVNPSIESPTKMEIEAKTSPPPPLDEELPVLQRSLAVPRSSLPPQPPPLPPKKPSTGATTQPPPQPPPLPLKPLNILATRISTQSIPAIRQPPTPPSSPVAMHFAPVKVPPSPSPIPLKMSRSISTPAPPPPPMAASKGSVTLLSPLPMPIANGVGPPPPPPAGIGRSLRSKKGATKLKRSSQMGNLYRVLKGQVEGYSLPGKSSNGKKTGGGNSAAGKQGMADALAEMTKRSTYFQQIEEDVRNYTELIKELQPAINTFKTKDMTELLKFYKQVENILEKLTDETQVLARFEGFPSKKLEALRMAAALYTKLESILTELQAWKVESPLAQLLDKLDRYFNKVKGDIDALERTKDEEAKKFKSHGIDFDFTILTHIKEAMVDVSSNCMEHALMERREQKDTQETEAQKKGSCKLLWKAFQFAFRVYTFAGGHDDRADKLTQEIANEIQNDPQNQ